MVMLRSGYLCTKTLITGTVMATSPMAEKRITKICFALFRYFQLKDSRATHLNLFITSKTGFSSSSLYIFICLYTFIYFSPLEISSSNWLIAVERSTRCSSNTSSLALHFIWCSWEASFLLASSVHMIDL